MSNNVKNGYKPQLQDLQTTWSMSDTTQRVSYIVSFKFVSALEAFLTWQSLLWIAQFPVVGFINRGSGTCRH
jgi:hypothetical protein